MGLAIRLNCIRDDESIQSRRREETDMIDDPSTVDRLMERMEAHLPIPVSPTRQLVQTLRQGGIKIHADRVLFIKAIFYFGDEGGISCDVTPEGGEDEPIVTSLTHLRIDPGHPLYHDIRAYQRERTRRIAETQ